MQHTHVTVNDIHFASQQLRQIVDKQLPPAIPGAKAYDLHARKNIRRARKDPRIRRMIRG